MGTRTRNCGWDVLVWEKNLKNVERELCDKLSPLCSSMNLSCKCVCHRADLYIRIQPECWASLSTLFDKVSLIHTPGKLPMNFWQFWTTLWERASITDVHSTVPNFTRVLNCPVGEPALQMCTVLHPTFLASEALNLGPYAFRASTLSTLTISLAQINLKKIWMTSTRHHWTLVHIEDFTGHCVSITSSYIIWIGKRSSHSPHRKRPRLISFQL